MALMSYTLEGMYNGVSQQPAPLRFDSQFSRQDNFSSNIVDGITKRPNTEFIAKLNSAVTDKSSIHNVNQSLDDKYKVIFTGDLIQPIEIIDLKGNSFNVSYESQEVKNYVFNENPRESTKALSLSDKVVILDTETTVKADYLTIEPLLHKTCMVWVKTGLPEIEYTVELFDINGVSLGSASFEQAASTNLNVGTVKTKDIAQGLLANLTSLLPNTDYNLYVDGSTIFYQYTGTDKAWDEIQMKVITTDSFGDTAMIPINQEVNGFEELPPIGIDHYPIAITGTNGIKEGAIYLEFDSSKNIWRETRAILGTKGQYIPDRLDLKTMPKALVKDGAGFKVVEIDWTENTVGDDKTSPMPSFIDRKVSNIFFYRGRLGFLCDDNIIFSKSNDFFNLFPTTASSVLYDDPIDVEVASRQVVNLKNALAYNRSLIVFSEQAQFTVGSSDEILTPTNIAVNTSTHFESISSCEPVQAGPNIFFPVSKGNYTAVREYFVHPDSHTHDAQDITAHVSRYIPEEVFKMTVSSAFDMLFVLSHKTPNVMYVYKYVNSQESRVQSAWFRWSLDPNEHIYDISMTDNWLYLITKNAQTGEVLLTRMDLREVPTGDLPLKIYLDRMTTTVGVFNDEEPYTYFQLPYKDGTSNEFSIVNMQSGLSLNKVEKVSENTLRVLGDYHNQEFYVGKAYKSIIEYSQFYIRNRQNLPDIQGKIQLKTLTVSFSTTGEFKIRVTPEARSHISSYVEGNENLGEDMSYDVQSSTFSGVILGDSIIGTPPVITGEHTFPLTVSAKRAKIELVADTYLPANFQLTAFEAEYNNRAKHL